VQGRGAKRLRSSCKMDAEPGRPQRRQVGSGPPPAEVPRLMFQHALSPRVPPPCRVWRRRFVPSEFVVRRTKGLLLNGLAKSKEVCTLGSTLIARFGSLCQVAACRGHSTIEPHVRHAVPPIADDYSEQQQGRWCVPNGGEIGEPPWKRP
jgi:hypothetical protein